MTTSLPNNSTKAFSALESRQYTDNLADAGFDLDRWEFLRFRENLNKAQQKELDNLEQLLEDCLP